MNDSEFVRTTLANMANKIIKNENRDIMSAIVLGFTGALMFTHDVEHWDEQTAGIIGSAQLLANKELSTKLGVEDAMRYAITK